MNKVIFNYFALFAIAIASSSPTENSFVISSTENTKENGKENIQNFSPTIYEMNIKSNISNRFATTLIISRVKNAGNSSKETTFAVVLPEKAFISEFVMEIGGKSYKAYVQEKEEAKKNYEQAVASGLSAGHVAVSARDSNRFTVSINIEAGSKATFLLTYEELLQRKNNQYELVLNIQPGQIVKTLNVEVVVNETRPLRFVKTPSLRSGNEISKNEDNLDPSSDISIINSTSAVVKFSPDVQKQREFARYLGSKESNGLSGQFVVQYDVERDPQGGEILLQDGYFVHFFAPDNLKLLPKYVVFVLDTSGSMYGTKINQLKDAMTSIIGELKTSDLLSIVEFNSDIKVWDILTGRTTTAVFNNEYTNPFVQLKKTELPAPVSINNVTLEKAKHVISAIQADWSTNIIGGIEAGLHLIKLQQEGLHQKETRHQPIMIFLTDGQANEGISNNNEITKIITELNLENNKVPIFSLSFGDYADKDFLKELSLKNFGFSRHIYEASDAALQLQEFYKQISSPALSNVTFKYADKAKELTDSQFPLYFQGTELVVSGRYQDTLEEGLPTRVYCWEPQGEITLRPTVSKPITSLERLWAYLTVQQALDKRATSENKTELTKKALDLSLKYSFVTDVTSLFVVKPNETTSAVNPEEAVDGGFSTQDRSYSSIPLIRGLAGPPPSYHYSSGAVDFRVAASYDYDDSDSFAVDSLKAYSPLLTTIPPFPSTTIGTTAKQTLTDVLPWLASVLNPNGTLTVSQGVFELGENATVTSSSECSKFPLNTTDKGICTLLQDCPEVYSSLTDFQVYQTYFCPINQYAGVCCPKKTVK